MPVHDDGTLFLIPSLKEKILLTGRKRMHVLCPEKYKVVFTDCLVVDFRYM